ncbi:hypothetical protein PPL_00696 [Heterostelium album PN500]|uniref:Uncharacterized protein n=1 Tax=Heterostelium pallidum (strain ATCC 26659 / Pp 5 / PN500) TaxID=670386 RepID=D3AX66_HETP5|nr:hypothetical protein PPL_00696 [Heterostelium album PN500]EFA86135.1 hypothetical protein PPL_00696 [Heterostelium album PN500]|eukprot:XP_020438240.1 hypothetical protein PPL_00696 [Heterostelium album PN500]
MALSGSGKAITHHYRTSDGGEVHETKTTTTSTTTTKSGIRTVGSKITKKQSSARITNVSSGGRVIF